MSIVVRCTNDGTVIKNFCPECIKENKKSSFITKDNRPPNWKERTKFYDENGERHVHMNDRNYWYSSGEWFCSYDHTGVYDKYLLCPSKTCIYADLDRVRLL